MRTTALSADATGRLRGGRGRPSVTDWILGARRRSGPRRLRVTRAVIAVAAIAAATSVWHAYQNRGAPPSAATLDEVASVDRAKVVLPALAPPAPAARPTPISAAEPVALATISPALGNFDEAPKPMQLVVLDSPVVISEMQRLLAKLDFRPGLPDGVLGHRTVEAIRIYQKFAGLEIDGMVTTMLLEDLRAVAAKMPEPRR